MVKLHPKFQPTLDRLEKAFWFANVGKHDMEQAIILSSWEEALEHSSSRDWKDIRLEAANQIRERLVAASPDRFETWNQIVVQVKPTVEELVQRKIAGVKLTHGLPKSFDSTVNWDILHLFMEVEYADTIEPDFYANLAFYYAAGHFPCGGTWSTVGKKGSVFVY